MAPGAKIGVKGSYGVKEIQVGAPAEAMAGLEFIIAQLNQGLGINAIRSGAGGDTNDKTATEITTADTKAEIRTSEFGSSARPASWAASCSSSSAANRCWSRAFSKCLAAWTGRSSSCSPTARCWRTTSAEAMASAGNIVPIVSIEGDAALTDERRGGGVGRRTAAAMERLASAGVPFGVRA